MDVHEVRRTWAERSGEYSPEYYAHLGPNATSDAVRRTLERHVDHDGSVLELGCSAGRHLAHLADGGFSNLAGIELNPDAVDVMTDAYPDLADAGTIRTGAIEDVVPELPDGRFDAVYSVETLQHVHPDAAWVFAELVRITDTVLVTVEKEGEADDTGAGDHAVNYVRDEVPLYYRDWARVFTDLGLVEVAVDHLDRTTMRTFRPRGNDSQ